MTNETSVSGRQSSPGGANHKLRRDPDADVLIALASGDPGALETLMQRHLGAIKSLAWHMMGDEMIAEDIAQDVFIKAWQHGPKWQAGNAKFSTWLYRVAKNLCYDRLRKKTEIYSDNLPDIADKTPNARRTIIEQEAQHIQNRYIQKAFAALPARQMMAITLCHYQNKSQKEAAEIMVISPRAYESLLARARRNLRKQLAELKKELLES